MEVAKLIALLHKPTILVQLADVHFTGALNRWLVPAARDCARRRASEALYIWKVHVCDCAICGLQLRDWPQTKGAAFALTVLSYEQTANSA